MTNADKTLLYAMTFITGFWFSGLIGVHPWRSWSSHGLF
jgi:hypothetical protein